VRARIGTGLTSSTGGVRAFAEAAERAGEALGDTACDLAMVFAGAPSLGHADEGLVAVHECLRPGALLGCGAQGVVGAGRELENDGVAVWAASLPGARVETFTLEALRGDGGMEIAGIPDLDGAEAIVLLADPYTFPVEPFLARVGAGHPGVPVVGGLASAGGGPGRGVLMRDGEVARQGAVGVTLAGASLRPCVSQGARPIGPEMVITAADGNVVYELASRPALERLKEAIVELEMSERALAAQGLLLGIVIDENQPEYERGDFLVRGLLSVDDSSGSITVGEQVRVGQTVRMHVRDGQSADEDLREALDRELRDLPGPAAGALVFTCNGRGSHMFGAPDHDAAAVDAALQGAPAAGFFCAGEIGPVGDRNFLHGFTATVAVFTGSVTAG